MTINFIIFSVIGLITFATQASRAPAADIRAEIEATIKATSQCKNAGNFYWEIGSATGAIVYDSVGTKYTADTEIDIASASKWIFAAYVYQKLGSNLKDEHKKYLRMQSGYTNMKNLACMTAKVQTIQDCFDAKPLVGKAHNTTNPKHVGKFFYAPGHAQALAVKLGMGPLTSASAADTVQGTLGFKGPFDYGFPQLAGTGSMTARGYADFLQRMMKDQYVLSKHLLSDGGICANKKCGASVADSPAPTDAKSNWWYGSHYWIEKTPAGKIEAYSSGGYYGFYPWISADKKYYGIIARKGALGTAATQSAACGKAIRDKFLAVYK